MKLYKNLITFVLITVMAFTLAGCNSGNTTPVNPSLDATAASAENASESSTADASEAASEGNGAGMAVDISSVYPLTVTGTDGHEVTLEKKPERVVSIAPNITELMFALDAGDLLVGRTSYCDYPAGAENIEVIGTLRKPDIEKIVSLNPDLVIVSTHSEDNIKVLTDAGLNVLSLYEEHDISGVYGMIDILGRAVDKNAQAASVIADMKEKIDSVESKLLLSSSSAALPVDVYYVVGFGEGGEYTAGGDTFINGILTAAGGHNIAEDISGWSYSLEALIAADPYVIILSENDYDTFTTTSPYSELTAVKEGRVYTIDTNMLDRQSNRNADAVVEIAHMLHPDLFN